MNIGHNTVGGERLRSYIERLEYLAVQKKQISDDEKVVFAEAKAQGFVASGVRYCLKARKMKPTDRQESEALADVYMHALGMASDTPLFRAVGLMSVDVTAREQIIEAMKKFVPANGSITIEAEGKPVRLTRDKDGNISVTDVEKIEPPPATEKQKAKPKAEIPDVDADGAEGLGRQAFNDNVPIIKNPFPYKDERRARWDKGWRGAAGSDGMDD